MSNLKLGQRRNAIVKGQDSLLGLLVVKEKEIDGLKKISEFKN